MKELSVQERNEASEKLENKLRELQARNETLEELMVEIEVLQSIVSKKDSEALQMVIDICVKKNEEILKKVTKIYKRLPNFCIEYNKTNKQ